MPELSYEERMQRIRKELSACTLCGNACAGDRISGERTICGAGALAEVAYAGIHRGEEPPISGAQGCGNIFFHRCGLSCAFCQNWQISSADVIRPRLHTPADLAGEMLRLQEAGTDTIGLVAPTSHIPTLVPALVLARSRGLRVPVVYNSSGYDSLHALTLMEGLVDVYLPDMKYGGDETARIYSGVANYVATSRAAVMEMFRQVGELTIDAHGVARSGLIIRHLVLPGGMADTMEVLQWIARHLPRSVHVSLMGQYQPAYEVDAGLFPEIDRKLTQDEYDFYVQIAQGLGLENLFIQSLSASADLNPDFDHPCPFG